VPGSVDGVEARRQAYLCSSLQKEPAIAACRRGLELGLSHERAATAYLLLGLNLSVLNRWPEAVDAYRGRVKLLPQDAEAHWRLGDALLFGLSQPKDALVPLREAVRLKPDLAGAHGSLAVALASSGAYPEAVAAFEDAVRLDPQYFTNRPAGKQVYEAARKGERWVR
jgi:tetratricopeptide (TPR) repeat protein